MEDSLLWFDSRNDTSFEEKLQQAVEYYEHKMGWRPTICYIHPGMLTDRPMIEAGIELRPTNMVLPNHFWLRRHSTRQPTAAA